MLYRNVKHFNPVDKVFIDYQQEIIRRMATELIMDMSEQDFLKLFEVKLTENHMAYYSPLEVEVKINVK